MRAALFPELGSWAVSRGESELSKPWFLFAPNCGCDVSHCDLPAGCIGVGIELKQKSRLLSCFSSRDFITAMEIKVDCLDLLENINHFPKHAVPFTEFL